MAFPKQPSLALGSARPGALTGAAAESKMIMWIATEKTTPFAPSLLERMARAKTLQTQWTKLIEKIRSVAQTNPQFRGERLVASANNMISDRQQLAMALNDSSLACFDNMKPLAQYMSELSNAQLAISGYQDVMLRQVMLFAVKPLKDYVTMQYPQILQAYTELEKRRDRYDNARRKKSPDTPNLQQQLADHACALDALLDAVSNHQKNGARAIDVLIRAERQFMKETMSIVKEVRGPDNKKRWASI